MPGIFGQIDLTAEQLTPPPAEHASEVLHRVRLRGLEMGVWSPAGTREADAVFSDSADLACVCDAEIVNRPELLAALGTDVPPPNGMAELLARLVAREGEHAFARLRGAFSIAVWDRGVFWAVVDRFTMKRLAYAQTGRGLRFGARTRWVGAGRSVANHALYHYLNLSFVPSPETIFTGVNKLAPGCWLRHEQGSVRTGCYWEMQYPEARRGSEQQLGAALKETLRGAVGASLAEIDPQRTGCFLSGGTDSSSVVGMVGEVSGKSTDAFSIGFAEEAFSELFYARTAVKHFGARGHERIVNADDAWRILPAMVRGFDEPFGNSSGIGGYLCAEMAVQSGMTTLLAGDGGDEIFGGNERYRKDKIYAWAHVVPRPLLANPVWDALARVPMMHAGRARQILYRASLRNPERFYLEDCLTADLNGNLLAPELADGAVPPLEIMRRYYEGVKAHSDLNRLLFIDLKLTISDNDLVKVGSTAAACGLRVRYPMLDHPLVEFTGDIGADMKVKGLEKRYLFKRALRGFLPAEIIRKKKQGFGVPVSVWFREDERFRGLLLEVIHDPGFAQRGWFRAGAVERMAEEHMRGVREWGNLLWAVLMLELWQREVAHA